MLNLGRSFGVPRYIYIFSLPNGRASLALEERRCRRAKSRRRETLCFSNVLWPRGSKSGLTKVAVRNLVK